MHCIARQGSNRAIIEIYVIISDLIGDLCKLSLLAKIKMLSLPSSRLHLFILKKKIETPGEITGSHRLKMCLHNFKLP